MALGTAAPDFSLPGTDGNAYSLASFAEADVLVVVFTCNHCPYAIASEDRLIELQLRYSARVRFVLVNSNDSALYPEDSFDEMVSRAKNKAFPFPYLHDASQEVARAYDAACTPDVFVFDAARALRYNGRIDDNWQHPEKVTRRDLEAVLDDLLAGRDISIVCVPSMGCSIKWK
jgi:peroxiredoxin